MGTERIQAVTLTHDGKLKFEVPETAQKHPIRLEVGGKTKRVLGARVQASR